MSLLAIGAFVEWQSIKLVTLSSQRFNNNDIVTVFGPVLWRKRKVYKNRNC